MRCDHKKRFHPLGLVQFACRRILSRVLFNSRVILILLLVTADRVAHGQVADAEKQEHDVASQVLSGFLSGRQEIHSGSYRANGVLREDDQQRGLLEGPIQIFCAFDNVNSRLRYDHTAPARIFPEDSNGDASIWKLGTEGGQFAKTKDYMLFRVGKRDTINKFDSERALPTWVKPYDIRSFGFAHQRDLDIGLPFENLRQIYATQPVTGVKEEGDLITLTWVVKFKDGTITPNFLRVVQFDRSKCYCPVSLETRSCISFAPPRPGQKVAGPIWSDVQQKQTIDYALFKDHWVPRKVVLDSGFRHEELTFDWETLNEDLSEKLFTEETFNTDGVRFLIGRKAGKPVVLREYDLPAQQKNP